MSELLLDRFWGINCRATSSAVMSDHAAKIDGRCAKVWEKVSNFMARLILYGETRPYS